jgi:hypothetical protein
MATILDYLPERANPRPVYQFDLHTPERIAFLVLGVIFFVWAFVSFLIVVANGGSIFDSKCRNSYEVIMKYSPPMWRTVSRCLLPFLILAFLALLFGPTIWHHAAN